MGSWLWFLRCVIPYHGRGVDLRAAGYHLVHDVQSIVFIVYLFSWWKSMLSLSVVLLPLQMENILSKVNVKQGKISKSSIQVAPFDWSYCYSVAWRWCHYHEATLCCGIYCSYVFRTCWKLTDTVCIHVFEHHVKNHSNRCCDDSMLVIMVMHLYAIKRWDGSHYIHGLLNTSMICHMNVVRV